MSDAPRDPPSAADVEASTLVYSHDHAGSIAADRVTVHRHPDGPYIHRSWGVDPDHGDYDSTRWVSAEDGPALLERLRAETEARYPETAPMTKKDLPFALGFFALVALVVAGLFLWLGRILTQALEAAPG